MDDKTFLEQIKLYIENAEETIDGEWGSARSLAQLIREEEMPELYHEVLRRLDAQRPS